MAPEREASESRAERQVEPRALRYAWYVVGVLMLVYVFSFLDRQIFSLIVGPLRRDLHISDTQVSLLQGFSFAVFYTFFGIPIGRLADVYNRRTIIVAGLLLWSAFTAGCGLAGTFLGLLLLRMGVGVGEAALSPAAYSLITDYFPARRLATAISVYSMGIYIGSGLSFLLGGIAVRYATTQEMWTLPIVGAMRPWQLIFFIVGLPGLLLVPLCRCGRCSSISGETARRSCCTIPDSDCWRFRRIRPARGCRNSTGGIFIGMSGRPG
jgi:MFS family permease